MHSRATDRRSASKCQGKWPDQTLDQAFGLPEVLVAVSTSRLSCKRARKTRTLMPVGDSSGESRIKRSKLAIPGEEYHALPAADRIAEPARHDRRQNRAHQADRQGHHQATEDFRHTAGWANFF